MNIEIKKVSNGWLVIISTPQGAMATYYKTHQEVLEELEAMMEPAVPDNVEKLGKPFVNPN